MSENSKNLMHFKSFFAFWIYIHLEWLIGVSEWVIAV